MTKKRLSVFWRKKGRHHEFAGRMTPTLVMPLSLQKSYFKLNEYNQVNTAISKPILPPQKNS